MLPFREEIGELGLQSISAGKSFPDPTRVSQIGVKFFRILIGLSPNQLYIVAEKGVMIKVIVA